ncbi:hypothetical protein EHI8A_044390 [Entamoeba histolytica HM-1:IMSS-B]|uniref:Uncharacterized protein n=6 Tax=Entamoeba histolytica TaxID=5759 RepID=C4M6I5_ENTH1|nr:hypothetical protein EHI_173460 [Entamoeba histolytica HM-1:IMSS]EMD44239.1 Hypothetical protein EHI5A_075260 [Entamoeba histolytica KU27]EMH75757.1 hypothetical protein EHI8A_044390 [Entamoeba histolytica HM-1:IMSS-B]EMS16399.1 hypothetical protein KM1_089120 [Entamoeba histolytica HM-3:IMSS]ENY64569.1 hypothetical protein EHI7A_044970 [Entamoeba histolytica HM-1:IMSS-A]GAT97099.1 hypothetical protein CL6EHI_173460 [Entamoeba histolytica]|eukprot:XP_649137.1 hypothetical protein EHI_173460 [Entamoeba histolytica HM-1:IMSS]
MKVIFLVLLGIIQYSYSNECTCTVSTTNMFVGECKNNDGNFVANSPECIFIINEEINGNILLESVNKLIVNSKNTFETQNNIITEIKVTSDVIFNNDGKLSDNQLIIEKLNATNENKITFGVNTIIKSSNGNPNIIITSEANIKYNGNINQLDIDGNLVMEQGSINDINVSGRSEVLLPEKIKINSITLETANFHLLVPSTDDFQIGKFIIKMNKGLISSIPLIHSENIIAEKFIDSLVVQDVTGTKLTGKLKIECARYEVFYVSQETTDVACQPITCIFKDNQFNIERCPFEEKQDGDSVIPTILLLKSALWKEEWNSKKLTSLIIDINNDNSLDFGRNTIKCSNLIIKSGKISIQDISLENVIVESQASLKLVNTHVQSLMSEDSTLELKSVYIEGYSEFKNTKMSIENSLYYAGSNKSLFKSIFNGVELSLTDGHIYTKTPIEIIVEELSIISQNYPIFIDESQSKFFFDDFVSVLGVDNDGIDACFQLVSSMGQNLITVNENSNVVIDLNKVSAFFCIENVQEPTSYLNCKIPKQPNGKYNMGLLVNLPDHCKSVSPSALNFIFEDDIIELNTNNVQSIGQVHARSLVIVNSEVQNEGELTTINKVEVEKLTISSHTNILELSLRTSSLVRVTSLLSLGILNVDGIKNGFFAITSTGSLEIIGNLFSNAKVIIENGGSFYSYNPEEYLEINNCEFEIHPQGVFKTNLFSKIIDSNIYLNLINEHALTFTKVIFDGVNIELRTTNLVEFNTQRKSQQYVAFAKGGIELINTNIELVSGTKRTNLKSSIECNKQWLFINRKNTKCLSDGLNIRGRETFAIPEHWKKQKKSMKWIYSIIVIPVIIAIGYILYVFIRQSNNTQHSNLMDD